MTTSLLDQPVASFLDAVAARTPTPGGGSVSALVGALGAALGAMAAAFTEAPAGNAAAGLLRSAAEALRSLVDADAAAYGRVHAAMQRPKGTPEEKAARTAALQEALCAAAEVPLDGMRRCVETLEQAVSFAPACNKNLASDLAIGAILLETACQGCGRNVTANLDWIRDGDFVRPRAEARDRLAARARELRERLLAICG